MRESTTANKPTADALAMLDAFLGMVDANYDHDKIRWGDSPNQAEIDAICRRLDTHTATITTLCERLYPAAPEQETATEGFMIDDTPPQSHAKFNADQFLSSAHTNATKKQRHPYTKEEILALARHHFIWMHGGKSDNLIEQAPLATLSAVQDTETPRRIMAKYWLDAHDALYRAAFDATLQPENEDLQIQLEKLTSQFSLKVTDPMGYFDYTPEASWQSMRDVILAKGTEDATFAKQENATAETPRTKPDLRKMSLSRVEAAKARGAVQLEGFAKASFGLEDLTALNVVSQGRSAA